MQRTRAEIEQAIEAILRQFAFAANDGKIWTAVRAAAAGLLRDLWSRGRLLGASPSEAFTIEVGLGSTMTDQDIREGYMIVQITLQLTRPAEFIELVFRQRMEEG